MPLLGTVGAGSVKSFGGLANLGYFIKNSLRFRRSGTGYLTRTPSSAGNRKTWTLSCWVKRGLLADENHIFTSGSGASAWASIHINEGVIQIIETQSGITYRLITTAVYRDPAAWYHIVVSMDTTQGTASNRLRLYVNGVQVTSFTTETYPTQNLDTWYNSTTAHSVGRLFDGSNPFYFDGYLAEVNFIDGQALQPLSFGKTDAATNQWIPKKYAGTYGTNGYYLKFADASAATAAAIGKDSSGNGNNYTPSGISVTSGATYDAMTDVPTLTNATTANYAVWNPLVLARNFDTNPQTIKNGNLVSEFTSNTTAGKFGGVSTIGVNSGKWYCEIVVTGGGSYPTYTNFGITGDPNYNAITTNASIGQQDYSVGWYNANGTVLRNGSSLFSGSTQSSPYTGMIALDVSAGKIYFGLNGTWINSANPASGTGGFDILAVSSTPTGQYFISCFFASTGMQGSYTLNAGQQPFAYTPPSGFNRLNTFNLP